MKNIVNNKTFWKIVKRSFSNKSKKLENISFIKNGKLLIDDFEISKTFNKYFQNLVHNLELKVPNNVLCQTTENGDEVLAATSKYQNYPSIKTILSFSFKTVSLTDVEKEMKSLDTNKVSHSSDITTKMLKNKT